MNVLTDSPEISDVTKRDVFRLNLTDKNETIEQKSFSLDFINVLDQSAHRVPKKS